MPQHKSVYFPQRPNDILERIDYEIMREEELAQVNAEIKPLDFRNTLLYHMEQMGITEPKLVDLCEDTISNRTVQRMLALDPNGRTNPKRENIVLICLMMRLPVSLSVNLVNKAGYSLMDGRIGQRLQKLLQQRDLSPADAKRIIDAILEKETT